MKKNSKSQLTIIDIDDTVANSPKLSVHVKNQYGKVVDKLSTSEFNTHKLDPDHTYDFKQFRCSKTFEQATPIKPMVDTVNAIQAKMSDHPHNKVVFVTARADFDDRDRFLNHMTKLGIKEMDKIHVHRAGNIPGDDPAARKKLVFIRKHLDEKPYELVRMYDDAVENLNAFLGLQKEYPGTRFHAFHVKEDGSFSLHEPKNDK